MNLKKEILDNLNLEVMAEVSKNPNLAGYEQYCGNDYFQSSDLYGYVQKELSQWMAPVYTDQDNVKRRDVTPIIKVIASLTQAYHNIKAREESEALAK